MISRLTAQLRLLWLILTSALLAGSCMPEPPACAPSSRPAMAGPIAGPCSPVLELEFRVDPAFTPEERELLARAAALWEAGSGGTVRITLGDVGNEIHRGGVDLPGMIGETRGQEIWIEPGPRFEAVAAHELGHALLGPGHSPDPESIMFATVRSCARLSKGDVEALAGVVR